MSLSSALDAAWERVLSWFFAPVDARVYACVRIAYAATCLVILLSLWPWRAAYLSAAGSLNPLAYPLVSPLAWSRAELTVTLTLLVAIAAALCLLLGRLTRFASLVLFVWHIAFVSAAYMVVSGFDLVVRLVGFVVLIGPQPRAWSLLRFSAGAPRGALRPREQREASEPAYALRLIQFQTCVMYLATVWLKAPDPFWRSGELMAYFQMSLFARWPTVLAAEFPGLAVVLTWSTLAIEVALPFLLLSTRFRRLGLLLGFLLHAGIAVTSTLQVFSLAMVPLYAAFLTGEDLDAVARLLRLHAPWLMPSGSLRPAPAAPDPRDPAA